MTEQLKIFKLKMISLKNLKNFIRYLFGCFSLQIKKRFLAHKTPTPAYQANKANNKQIKYTMNSISKIHLNMYNVAILENVEKLKKKRNI